MIVEDGKKGEIKQVTNQPYSVIGKDGAQGTAFAEVGIVTAITPTLIGEKSGSVHMEMSFKVSSLVGNTPGGAPITSANEMASTVTVRDRQSAAVGGLIRNSTSTGYNRPSGQKNPIISLYASKDFIKQQSQFVVFVTPIVKASASAGVEQTKKKFRFRD
ncbi:Bacterial type II and III secretion system protein [compost metagenome]